MARKDVHVVFRLVGLGRGARGSFSCFRSWSPSAHCPFAAARVRSRPRARLFDEALVYLGIEPGKNGFFIYTLGMPTHYQDRQRPYVHNVVRVHQAASLAFCTTPSNFFASVSPSCKKPHPHEMPVAGRPAATRSSGVMDAIFSCRCR